MIINEEVSNNQYFQESIMTEMFEELDGLSQPSNVLIKQLPKKENN